VLEHSAARVAERLRAAGVAGRTITVHLRFDDHTTATRSRTLQAAVDDATVIAATAASLVDTPRRLTRIGVSVSNLEVAPLALWAL
jgi:DNA polymerase-4